VTPLDILPYYFAIEPSPTDARSAFGIARPASDGADVGVSLVIEDENECTEVFRFSHLDFVRIAWSPAGRLLAFAQNSTLMVRNQSGTLQLGSLAEAVQWLGFDREERLWCLAGSRLEVRLDNQVKLAVDCVESVAVAERVAYCRREKQGLSIYLHDSDDQLLLACLSEPDELKTVKLSVSGNYLVLALGSTVVKDRARVRIVRFDLVTSKMEMLLDEDLAFGFNGGPGISAVALSTGEVLAAYENGGCSQVWTLAPGTSPRPISPNEFEVFDFVVDPSGNQLAIIASDTRASLGVSERQLLIGQKEQSDWHFSTPVAGVYDMPRWRHDGQLEVLCGDYGRWTRRIFAPNETNTVVGSEWCQSASVHKDGIEYDFVTLPGPQHRQAAIILLPRLHQQFVAGAQSFFFHHLLFSIARSLAMEGYTVVVLNGPGAIGRGRVRREPAGSYFARLRSALHDLTQSLRAEGCGSVGILAGSLAAVAALRLMGCGSPFSAAAFVAPLFESSIPVTKPLEHHLVSDPLVDSFDEAAMQLSIPMLVIHGACDEVAPLWQVSHLYKQVRNQTLVELCILEEEGHIFKQTRSWQRAQATIEKFFASHLRLSSVVANTRDN
jgi:prolyl oligopeptidase family protein